MAHIKNFFSNLFKKYSIEQTGDGFHIHINFKPIGDSLDRAQFALDTQVSVDMQKYMPFRQGTLINRTNLLNQQHAGEGKVYKYDDTLEYAHYMYEGEKYVDPVYRVGGFFSPSFGWWSRPGVKKVPSGEPLFYTRETAEAHWDDVAYARHGKDWLKVVKRAMRG